MFKQQQRVNRRTTTVAVRRENTEFLRKFFVNYAFKLHFKNLPCSTIPTTQAFMHISKETIDTIAELSRLEFRDDEKSAFITQFENIIEYFNQLESFDVEGVEPLKSIMDTGENAFREDAVSDTVSTADALANAPKHNGVFFKVPKVLG